MERSHAEVDRVVRKEGAIHAYHGSEVIFVTDENVQLDKLTGEVTITNEGTKIILDEPRTVTFDAIEGPGAMGAENISWSGDDTPEWLLGIKSRIDGPEVNLTESGPVWAGGGTVPALEIIHNQTEEPTAVIHENGFGDNRDTSMEITGDDIKTVMSHDCNILDTGTDLIFSQGQTQIYVNYDY
jgi:hypothetical protein